LWRALVIRRSILTVLLCFSISLPGHAWSSGPLCFCLLGTGVWAGLRDDMPLCLDHEVVGQPHRALVVQALMPPPRVEVATCALGNFWLGVQAHIPRPPGP